MCLQLLQLVGTLKDRCYELTDEVGANQDLVNALRHSVMSTHNQLAALYVHSQSSSIVRKIDSVHGG